LEQPAPVVSMQEFHPPPAEGTGAVVDQAGPSGAHPHPAMALPWTTTAAPRRRARRALCQVKIAAPPTTETITQAPPFAKIEPCTARSPAAPASPMADAPSGSSLQTRRCRPERIAANGTADVAAR